VRLRFDVESEPHLFCTFWDSGTWPKIRLFWDGRVCVDLIINSEITNYFGILIDPFCFCLRVLVFLL